MANFHFYLSTLLLLLLTPRWRTATGHPLRTDNCAQCAPLFRGLLLNIAELLDNDVFCYGITSDKLVVRSEETALACAPTLTQNSSCMMQRNSSFSESECLSNIMKDLVYHDAAIRSYLQSALRSPEEEEALLSPTLGIIKSLKNCSLMPNEENVSEEEAAKMWGSDTYTNRQEMCKMMRGLYVRTITINRAVSYITSGDHMK